MSQQQAKKRPYRKPTLAVYGTLADVTRTVGGRGRTDGGSKGRVKTGPTL